jgi:hypothetical protein
VRDYQQTIVASAGHQVVRLTERDNDNVLRLKATAFEIQSQARQTGSPDTYESSTLRISELVKAQEGIRT